MDKEVANRFTSTRIKLHREKQLHETEVSLLEAALGRLDPVRQSGPSCENQTPGSYLHCGWTSEPIAKNYAIGKMNAQIVKRLNPFERTHH